MKAGTDDWEFPADCCTSRARQIKDALGNEYARPKDITGEVRHTFTSPANTAFDVCFDNILTGRGTLKSILLHASSFNALNSRFGLTSSFLIFPLSRIWNSR